MLWSSRCCGLPDLPSWGGTHHATTAEAQKPGRGTPSPATGLTMQEGDFGQRKLCSIFFPIRFFFLFLSKTAEVLEEFCISSIKGLSHGPWSTVRRWRKPGWQQGCMGKDALLTLVGLLASGDREDGGPDICVPHGEGTRGTQQLPVLPSL